VHLQFWRAILVVLGVKNIEVFYIVLRAFV